MGEEDETGPRKVARAQTGELSCQREGFRSYPSAKGSPEDHKQDSDHTGHSLAL